MIYRTLHTYILRELLRVFLLTASALTTLMAFGGMFRPITKQGIDVSQVLVILINLMPAMLAYAIPIAALFAAVLVYWRMATDNELTACRAGGISHFSMILPAILLGTAVASADLVFVNYVVPQFLQKTERLVFRDLGSLIVSQINRQERFPYRGLVVSADYAELLPSDDPDVNIAVLHGLAVTMMDSRDPDKPVATVVGQEAQLRIRNLAGQDALEIDISLSNCLGFNPANAFQKASGSASTISPDGRPFRVPSFFRNRPKFLNWRDLIKFSAKPYLFSNVAAIMERIEQARQYEKIADNILAWWQQSRAQGTDSISFSQSAIGAGRNQISLHAARVRLNSEGDPREALSFSGDGAESGGVRVEQRVDGKLATVYTCDAADLVLAIDQFTSSGISAALRLRGNVVRENRQQPGLSPVKVPTQTVTGLILDSAIKQVPPLPEDAKGELMTYARESKRAEVQKLGGDAQIEVTKLFQTIDSELHSRGSFALSCLTLVLLGAALGILLHGKNPLAVFVVGFVPAIILVLLITGGRQLTESKNPHNVIPGIILIWAGNGILLAIVVGVYANSCGGNMRILDRYILKSFLVNYLLALCVLVGMYVLMDIIVNVQDFAKGASAVADAATPPTSAWDIARDMGDYYLYQFPVIYQQIAGIIPLLAAGFTMVRMTRHNELTAMMSSGVSLYRVAAPIILISAVFTIFQIVNQEFIISQPQVIEKLLRRHDEVNAPNTKKVPLWFIKDQDGSYLSALQYCPPRSHPVSLQAPDTITRSTAGSFLVEGVRPGFVVTLSGFANPANNGDFTVTAADDRTLRVAGAHFVPQTARDGALLSVAPAINDIFLVERDEAGTPLRHTLANFAQWLPDPTPGGVHEAWVMHEVNTEDDNTQQPDARHFQQVVRRTELSPSQINLILSKKAVDYLSSERVHELARYSPDINKPLLYKIMYLRFTQPLMNIVMLLIGIPFLLTREPNRLVVNMFYCVGVIGFIFVATFVLFQTGGNQINPLWAAWLPVLIFGPFTVVMLDSVKT